MPRNSIFKVDGKPTQELLYAMNAISSRGDETKASVAKRIAAELGVNSKNLLQTVNRQFRKGTNTAVVTAPTGDRSSLFGKTVSLESLIMAFDYARKNNITLI